MSSHDYGHGEGTLSAAMAQVAEARSDFTQLAAGLEARIQGQAGQWEGSGARSFFALHRAWTDRQRVIVGALDRFADALRSAEADNLATDDAQSAALLRLQGRLG